MLVPADVNTGDACVVRVGCLNREVPLGVPSVDMDKVM